MKTPMFEGEEAPGWFSDEEEQGTLLLYHCGLQWWDQEGSVATWFVDPPRTVPSSAWF